MLHIKYDASVDYIYTTTWVVHVSDLPRVSKLPAEIFLARGLPASLDCPVTANPPVTSVVWAKDERVVAPLVPKDSASDDGARLTTDRRGSLLFRSVSTQDEGRYACTPYSPLGVGQASRPVRVHVRGWSANPPSFRTKHSKEIGEIPTTADRVCGLPGFFFLNLTINSVKWGSFEH